MTTTTGQLLWVSFGYRSEFYMGCLGLDWLDLCMGLNGVALVSAITYGSLAWSVFSHYDTCFD